MVWAPQLRFAVLTLALLASGLEARAGNIFKAANFPVEAKAKNAVLAKKAAIAEGQTAAYRSLLKRLVPVTAYNRLERLRDIGAAQFIESMEVRSERNSSTEYIANIDFVFRGDVLRDLLRQDGVPFIEQAAHRTVVVPVMRREPGQKIQRTLGAWGSIWKTLDLENSITPVEVKTLLASIDERTLKKNDSELSALIGILENAYNNNQVVVALAERDKSVQKLHVRLIGRDAVGPINFARSYRVFDGDYGFASELAAVVSLGILEGRWKEVQLAKADGSQGYSGPGQTVFIKVEFQSPSQWYRIQQHIAGVPGVKGLQVASLSARSADVSLSYPGGGGQLAGVLTAQGYSMLPNGSQWLLRPNF